NRVVDRAIAQAVDAFAKERAIEFQKRREEHLTFVMHDLRTPLAAMHTAGQILESTLPPEARTERVIEMLELQKRNAEPLNALLKVAIQEGLNIESTAVGSLKIVPQEFDLWSLVEGVIHDLRPLSEKASVQIVNVTPQHLVIGADAVLISEVFQNLL